MAEAEKAIDERLARRKVQNTLREIENLVEARGRNRQPQLIDRLLKLESQPSGPRPSGIKQFKARLTGPGMRCSRSAAERMFVLPSAVLDDSFDRLWAAT